MSYDLNVIADRVICVLQKDIDSAALSATERKTALLQQAPQLSVERQVKAAAQLRTAAATVAH